jgi:hypothetical protein
MELILMDEISSMVQASMSIDRMLVLKHAMIDAITLGIGDDAIDPIRAYSINDLPYRSVLLMSTSLDIRALM